MDASHVNDANVVSPTSPTPSRMAMQEPSGTERAGRIVTSILARSFFRCRPEVEWRGRQYAQGPATPAKTSVY